MKYMKYMKWMKRGISISVFLALFVCMSIIKSDVVEAVTVQKVFGTTVNCDTALSGCQPILLTVSLICAVGGGCPMNSVASFTDSSRFWGRVNQGVQVCRTSIDGGATWANCTTQPFSVGENSTPEHYGSASDGSVIAVSTVTAGTVGTIRRSTNNGLSWSTVFSEAGVSFSTSLAGGNLEAQYVICLSNGNCEFVANMVGGGGTFRVYRSSNNGASWTAGEVSIAVTGCPSSGTAWNGNAGISSYTSACAGVIRTYTAIADVWALLVWGADPGSCWGPVTYNNIGRVVCGNATNYTMYEGNGTSLATLTLPGALKAVDVGGISYSTKTNVLYILAGDSTNNGRVYISINNLVTFFQIGTINLAGGAMRGGNMYEANGCIYFSTGFTNIIFGKIC